MDDAPPPPPSPLSGCYLLIVLGEPHSPEHRDVILGRVAKGFLSWDIDSSHVDLEKELQALTSQAPAGEQARNGERLIQYATENLVTEVLIHPQINTLLQCVRNALSSFTRHRHLIHAGYTFASSGSWILQDGTFSLADFIDAFQESEVQRVLRAYENGITVDVHCSPEGDWTTERMSKETFSRFCKVRVNPDDRMTAGGTAIGNFINYLSPFLKPTPLEGLLESSDVVGNIRFSHPTLYVFPGGQGDAALFGINGFNMLVDGGFTRKACFWDFARHLDRLDAVLITRLNNGNVNGIASVLRRKKGGHVYPQIGHFFCNMQEKRQATSPDGDKDRDPLLIDLAAEAHEMVLNLRQLSLRPHPCYSHTEPINLYHKVGHGKLDMYVLSPARDSREVKDFLSRWASNDVRLFSCGRKDSTRSDFLFPLQNLVSICALLVWQPANPNESITRIMFPGSTPQHKIFDGVEKLRYLEFLKHPVCSARSLSPSASSVGISSRKQQQIRSSTPAVIDKLLPGEGVKQPPIPAQTKTDKQILKSATIPVSGNETPKQTQKPAAVPPAPAKATQPSVKPKTERIPSKTEPSKPKTDNVKPLESEKPSAKQEKTVTKTTTEVSKQKSEQKTTKVEAKILAAKTKQDAKPPKPTEKKSQKAPSSNEKKTDIKSSPTTPKKTIEPKVNGVAPKGETVKPPRTSSKTRPSPTATPAKSAKDANNRKVVESKYHVSRVSKSATSKPSKVEDITATTSSVKTERKPISRRPKPTPGSPGKISPSRKPPGSPAKSSSAKSTPTPSVKSDKDGVIRRARGETGKITTDSSAVSTPSTAEPETTLKVKEVEVSKLGVENGHDEKNVAELKTDIHPETEEIVKKIEKVEVEVTSESPEKTEQDTEDTEKYVDKEPSVKVADEIVTAEEVREVDAEAELDLKESKQSVCEKEDVEATEEEQTEEIEEEEVVVEVQDSLKTELELDEKPETTDITEENEEDDEDEYLIIEKEEVESIQEQESVESHLRDEYEARETEVESDELPKHLKDEVESEKMGKIDDDKVPEVTKEADNKLKMEEVLHDSKPVTQEPQETEEKIETVVPQVNGISSETKEQLEEEVQEIISSAKDIVTKTKLDDEPKTFETSESKLKEIAHDIKEETSESKKDIVTSDELKEVSSESPEEKVDISSEKNREITETDQKLESNEVGEDMKETGSREMLDQKYPAEESQPDEKFSTTIESGATTAPTLPEDERIPLDEIKEIVEEKHIREETKEREEHVVIEPRIEQPTTLPQVVLPIFEAHTPQAMIHRDIVKTPDEVADLPVHEEVDPGMYDTDDFTRDFHKSKDEINLAKQQQELEETNQQPSEIDIRDEVHLKEDIENKLNVQKQEEGEIEETQVRKLPEKDMLEAQVIESDDQVPVKAEEIKSVIEPDSIDENKDLIPEKETEIEVNEEISDIISKPGEEWLEGLILKHTGLTVGEEKFGELREKLIDSGIHKEPTEPLPKEEEEWLNDLFQKYTQLKSIEEKVGELKEKLIDEITKTGDDIQDTADHIPPVDDLKDTKQITEVLEDVKEKMDIEKESISDLETVEKVVEKDIKLAEESEIPSTVEISDVTRTETSFKLKEFEITDDSQQDVAKKEYDAQKHTESDVTDHKMEKVEEKKLIQDAQPSKLEESDEEIIKSSEQVFEKMILEDVSAPKSLEEKEKLKSEQVTNEKEEEKLQQLKSEEIEISPSKPVIGEQIPALEEQNEFVRDEKALTEKKDESKVPLEDAVVEKADTIETPVRSKEEEIKSVTEVEIIKETQEITPPTAHDIEIVSTDKEGDLDKITTLKEEPIISQKEIVSKAENISEVQTTQVQEDIPIQIKEADIEKETPSPSSKEADIEREAASPSIKEADMEREAASPSVKEADIEREAASPSIKEADIEREAASPSVKEADIERESAIPSIKEADIEREAPSPAIKEANIEGEAASPLIVEADIKKESASLVSKPLSEQKEEVLQKQVTQLESEKEIDLDKAKLSKEELAKSDIDSSKEHVTELPPKETKEEDTTAEKKVADKDKESILDITLELEKKPLSEEKGMADVCGVGTTEAVLETSESEIKTSKEQVETLPSETILKDITQPEKELLKEDVTEVCKTVSDTYQSQVIEKVAETETKSHEIEDSKADKPHVSLPETKESVDHVVSESLTAERDIKPETEIISSDILKEELTETQPKQSEIQLEAEDSKTVTKQTIPSDVTQETSAQIQSQDIKETGKQKSEVHEDIGIKEESLKITESEPNKEKQVASEPDTCKQVLDTPEKFDSKADEPSKDDKAVDKVPYDEEKYVETKIEKEHEEVIEDIESKMMPQPEPIDLYQAKSEISGTESKPESKSVEQQQSESIQQDYKYELEISEKHFDSDLGKAEEKISVVKSETDKTEAYSEPVVPTSDKTPEKFTDVSENIGKDIEKTDESIKVDEKAEISDKGGKDFEQKVDKIAAPYSKSEIEPIPDTFSSTEIEKSVTPVEKDDLTEKQKVIQEDKFVTEPSRELSSTPDTQLKESSDMVKDKHEPSIQLVSDEPAHIVDTQKLDKKDEIDHKDETVEHQIVIDEGKLKTEILSSDTKHIAEPEPEGVHIDKEVNQTLLTDSQIDITAKETEVVSEYQKQDIIPVSKTDKTEEHDKDDSADLLKAAEKTHEELHLETPGDTLTISQKSQEKISVQDQHSEEKVYTSEDVQKLETLLSKPPAQDTAQKVIELTLQKEEPIHPPSKEVQIKEAEEVEMQSSLVSKDQLNNIDIKEKVVEIQDIKTLDHERPLIDEVKAESQKLHSDTSDITDNIKFEPEVSETSKLVADKDTTYTESLDMKTDYGNGERTSQIAQMQPVRETRIEHSDEYDYPQEADYAHFESRVDADDKSQQTKIYHIPEIDNVLTYGSVLKTTHITYDEGRVDATEYPHQKLDNYSATDIFKGQESFKPTEEEADEMVSSVLERSEKPHELETSKDFTVRHEESILQTHVSDKEDKLLKEAAELEKSHEIVMDKDSKPILTEKDTSKESIVEAPSDQKEKITEISEYQATFEKHVDSQEPAATRKDTTTISEIKKESDFDKVIKQDVDKKVDTFVSHSDIKADTVGKLESTKEEVIYTHEIAEVERKLAKPVVDLVDSRFSGDSQGTKLAIEEEDEDEMKQSFTGDKQHLSSEDQATEYSYDEKDDGEPPPSPGEDYIDSGLEEEPVFTKLDAPELPEYVMVTPDSTPASPKALITSQEVSKTSSSVKFERTDGDSETDLKVVSKDGEGEIEVTVEATKLQEISGQKPTFSVDFDESKLVSQATSGMEVSSDTSRVKKSDLNEANILDDLDSDRQSAFAKVESKFSTEVDQLHLNKQEIIASSQEILEHAPTSQVIESDEVGKRVEKALDRQHEQEEILKSETTITTSVISSEIEPKDEVIHEKISGEITTKELTDLKKISEPVKAAEPLEYAEISGDSKLKEEKFQTETNEAVCLDKDTKQTSDVSTSQIHVSQQEKSVEKEQIVDKEVSNTVGAESLITHDKLFSDKSCTLSAQHVGKATNGDIYSSDHESVVGSGDEDAFGKHFITTKTTKTTRTIIRSQGSASDSDDTDHKDSVTEETFTGEDGRIITRKVTRRYKTVVKKECESEDDAKQVEKLTETISDSPKLTTTTYTTITREGDDMIDDIETEYVKDIEPGAVSSKTTTTVTTITKRISAKDGEEEITTATTEEITSEDGKEQSTVTVTTTRDAHGDVLVHTSITPKDKQHDSYSLISESSDLDKISDTFYKGSMTGVISNAEKISKEILQQTSTHLEKDGKSIESDQLTSSEHQMLGNLSHTTSSVTKEEIKDKREETHTEHPTAEPLFAKVTTKNGQTFSTVGGRISGIYAEDYESDEDEDGAGSPVSITSQAAHSPPTSHFEFETVLDKHKFDPLDSDRLSSHKKMDDISSFSLDTVPSNLSQYQETELVTSIKGEIKNGTSKEQECKLSVSSYESGDQEEQMLDFKQAMQEHRTARGEDLTSSSKILHSEEEETFKIFPSVNGQKRTWEKGDSEKNGHSSHIESEHKYISTVETKQNGKEKEDVSPSVTTEYHIIEKLPSENGRKAEELSKQGESSVSQIIKESIAPTIQDTIHQEASAVVGSSSYPEPPHEFAHLPSEKQKDPIESWGKPLGLPAPAPPPTNNITANGDVDTMTPTKQVTPKKEKKASQVKKSMVMNENNKTALTQTAKESKSKRSESPVKAKGGSNKESNKLNKMPTVPIYVDLTYVPHHGNSYYTSLEFFKKVRARYYVFSGTEPSREVYNALLEAKQTWDDKDLEVTIIPTYDTDTLGYWVSENEELLAKYKIDLSPSASRCTINLQDHETSCSAYRLEF